eukprot:scaffold345_cov134-Cylindrotheca_fusiformis.AAC.31
MMSRRRKTRNQSRKEVQAKEKENQDAQVPPSPTPYWKVAEERGTSPRQTRSAKKKRLSVSRFNFSPPKTETKKTFGNNTMVFSPPDQKANAKRAKEETERKEAERAARIQKARDDGQLLVFSPTFSRPAQYKNQDRCNEEEGQEKASALKTAPSRGTGTKNAEDASCMSEDLTVTPQDMEVQLARHDSKSHVSSFGMTMSDDGTSERITDELRHLRETIHQLVEQSKQQPETSKEQLRALDLEAQKQMLQTENLSKENSKLENANRVLEQKLQEIESKKAEEREKLVTRTTRLEAELAAFSKEANIQINGLQEVRRNLETQLSSLNDEKVMLSEKVPKLEKEVNDARHALNENKLMVEALKKEFNAEKLALEDDRKSLIEANSKLSTDFENIRQTNESLNATIESYESKIIALENDLLPESEEQLHDALCSIRRLEKAETEYKSQLAQYKGEIERLRASMEALEEQKEEERANFQTLNEDSHQAYEKLMKNLGEKNDIIQELKRKLSSTEESLDLASNKVDQMNSAMERLQAEVDERVGELEQSLTNSIEAMDKVTNEKKELQQQLEKACEQIDKDQNFMEEMLAASKNKSVALEETDKLRMVMQRKIEDLEQKLRKTTEERDQAQERMTTFNDREVEFKKPELTSYPYTEALFQKLRASDQVRRDLHNRVMQLSGNIRVYVRVRPALSNELEISGEPPANARATCGQKRKHANQRDESPFSFPGQLAGLEERMAKKQKVFGADDPTKNIVEVTEPYKDRGGLSARQKKWTFGFDHIFDPSHGQADVWDATEPLVQSAIDGFDVCVLAYGQTGSGKTFTMLGEEGNEGIVTRAVEKLFKAKKEIEDLSRGEKTVELSVELLEVYNEKVRDLLVPNSGPDGQELSLKVSANEAVGSKILPVGSKGEVLQILEMAQRRRCVKATSSNAVSSRSHMIFTILFSVTSKSGANRVGKLHICDLAGSERLGKSNANERVGSSLLRETKHINKSLSVLSNVIEKLQAGDKNIPYRESKLTYLLQNSLGGNSKTLAIVCCNPLQSHFHESLCSLRFAAKVNKVDLKAVANFSC